MLKGKINKTWAESCGKWMYQQNVAYLDKDGDLQTVLLLGWSEFEIDGKYKKLQEALETE